MMYILSLSKVSRSEAEQAGLNLTWSKIPDDTFSHDDMRPVKKISNSFDCQECPSGHTRKPERKQVLLH